MKYPALPYATPQRTELYSLNGQSGNFPGERPEQAHRKAAGREGLRQTIQTPKEPSAFGKASLRSPAHTPPPPGPNQPRQKASTLIAAFACKRSFAKSNGGNCGVMISSKSAGHAACSPYLSRKLLRVPALSCWFAHGSIAALHPGSWGGFPSLDIDLAMCDSEVICIFRPLHVCRFTTSNVSRQTAR